MICWAAVNRSATLIANHKIIIVIIVVSAILIFLLSSSYFTADPLMIYITCTGLESGVECVSAGDHKLLPNLCVNISLHKLNGELCADFISIALLLKRTPCTHINNTVYLSIYPGPGIECHSRRGRGSNEGNLYLIMDKEE